MHCSKNKNFEILYEIQLWIKDYFRAAISCTLFYKSQATTYAQLAKNEEHLLTAISHFELFLKQTENISLNGIYSISQLRNTKTTILLFLQYSRYLITFFIYIYIHTDTANDLIKIVKPSAVAKYLNTIRLQLEITRIICANNICMNTTFQRVPTLFDKKPEKLELISFIFDAVDDINSAFLLSYR